MIAGPASYTETSPTKMYMPFPRVQPKPKAIRSRVFRRRAVRFSDPSLGPSRCLRTSFWPNWWTYWRSILGTVEEAQICWENNTTSRQECPPALGPRSPIPQSVGVMGAGGEGHTGQVLQLWDLVSEAWNLEYASALLEGWLKRSEEKENASL